MALAMDRKSGALKGDITSQYLSAVFARHANQQMPFHPQYLNTALLYLRAQSADSTQVPPAAAGSAGAGDPTLNVYG